MRPVAQVQQMNERVGGLDGALEAREREKRELRDEVAQQKRSLAESAQKQKQQAQQMAQLEEQLGALSYSSTYLPTT